MARDLQLRERWPHAVTCGVSASRAEARERPVRAEVVGVGTELLLGQIPNTNARWISERLAEIGVDVLYHQVVGDNPERIEEALRHAELEDMIRAKFDRVGRDMPESNLVQADVPEGARVILPDRGTAPGLAVAIEGTRLYALPGVPAEMREMMEGTVLRELSSLAGPASIASR